MLITKDDTYRGYTMERIKEYIQYSDKYTRNEFKGYKKEIALINAIAKQLFKYNKELLGEWNKHKNDNFDAFVQRIIMQIKDGFYKIEQLGQIEALDNGSRGLSRTLQMHLYDVSGNILDVSEEFQSKYR